MQSHDPTYPLFPIFAFLGFLVSIIPLPWHLQAWNAGTCAFMIWTGLSCLSEFINSIIWRGNVLNVAPVWCDICELSFGTLAFIAHLFSFQADDWRWNWYPRFNPLYQPSPIQHYGCSNCFGHPRGRGLISSRLSPVLTYLVYSETTRLDR